MSPLPQRQNCISFDSPGIHALFDQRMGYIIHRVYLRLPSHRPGVISFTSFSCFINTDQIDPARVPNFTGKVVFQAHPTLGYLTLSLNLTGLVQNSLLICFLVAIGHCSWKFDEINKKESWLLFFNYRQKFRQRYPTNLVHNSGHLANHDH